MYLALMALCGAYVALMILGLTWAVVRGIWRALFPRHAEVVQQYPWERTERLNERYWPKLN